MYKSGYVVTIRKDDQTLKESNGAVLLPFGTEYQIRLRNKTRKRVAADVYVDGRVVAQGIIVDTNGFVDLERFLEGHSLASGPKIKFVPVRHHKVKDKGEPENGNIEVTFYPEKELEPIKFVTNPVAQYCGCIGFYCYWCGNRHCSCNSWPHPRPSYPIPSAYITYTAGTVTGNYTVSGGPEHVSSAADANNSLGASVEGSQSNHSFSSTCLEVDHSKGVTINLALQGTKESVVVRPTFCVSCGRKRRAGDNFCPCCGTNLEL